MKGAYVYNDNRSTFKQLLEKDNSVSIHSRNLQALAIEMFKVYKEQGPEILSDVFPLNSQSAYHVRSHAYFATRPTRTVHYGENSLRYLGQKIWELIPSHIKNAETVHIFKSNIKTALVDFVKLTFIKLDLFKIHKLVLYLMTFLCLVLHFNVIFCIYFIYLFIIIFFFSKHFYAIVDFD